jgi:dethiobiotin synthetase
VRGLFVTGTGTGVGKTIVSATLLAAMRAAGEPVRAHKPVVTGLAEPSGFGQSPEGWPPDHELLALAAGMAPEEVAPLRYDSPFSPHLAAALAGQSIDTAALIARARAAGSLAARTPAGSGGDTEPSEAQAPVLIVEGVGGLLVPIANDFSVRDLAAELALPVIVASPPGLGTINHTLLTLEAARSAGLDVAAVVLTPWPAEPSRMEWSNLETIARLGAIEVALLEEIASADIPALALAGDRLPWRDWLSRTSFVAAHP